jgi:cell shape-determining protein MreC
MEKSIKKTRKVKIDLNSPQLLGDLQAQLIQERQNNYAMQKENERLRRKVHYKKNYQHDLNCLQEDYHNLVESFMKSEEIRKKQKTLIRNLKSSIMN